MNRMAGKQRSFGTRAPTLAQRKARAVNLIVFCRPEKRDALTAEEVARFAGVPLAWAELTLENVRKGVL